MHATGAPVFALANGTMTMTGSVRHLSLVSLSLGAGRRSADMPSPGRDQGPLDPATKVLEMESLGGKVGSCLYAYIPAESTHSVQSWHTHWVIDWYGLSTLYRFTT